MNLKTPLILDGAMGTQLHKRGLPRGACTEEWVLAHPAAVADIQGAYVAAGSQVVYAPTFGANRVMLEKHGLFNKVEPFNAALVALSKAAVKGRAFVAGDISSVGGVLYPMGDMRFEDLYDIYLEQAAALNDAGVDLFVIETMIGVPEARAAVLAVKAVSDKPVFVSFTCDAGGRTAMGSDVCAALNIMEGMGVDAFGLNCSVGPAEMTEQIKRLYAIAHVPVIAKPNAGLPVIRDGEAHFDVDSKAFAACLPALIDAGASIIGGCCGSDESFIAEIKDALSRRAVRNPAPQRDDCLPCATEKDAFFLPADAACQSVFACDDTLEDNLAECEPGELICVEIASAEDVQAFADVQYLVRNPLCIQCDDAGLLEKALRVYQGRALYDGCLGDDELLPLVKRYGLII